MKNQNPRIMDVENSAFFQGKITSFFIPEDKKKSIWKNCNHFSSDWAGKACRFSLYAHSTLLASVLPFVIQFLTISIKVIDFVLQLLYDINIKIELIRALSQFILLWVNWLFLLP